ncbi:MAG: 30S ribosomal protein S20 [Bifidobacterium sp.]|nr:30S ribosomal protein S20 [Bifidobacterium sp.]
MANIKSQKKRVLTNEKAHMRNVHVKSGLKTAIRHTREAIASGDKAKAEEMYAIAARKLDQAAGKGVIHKNNAANRKSGLALQINKMA